MVIPEFVCGVVATLFVEMAALVISAIFVNRKKGK